MASGSRYDSSRQERKTSNGSIHKSSKSSISSIEVASIRSDTFGSSSEKNLTRTDGITKDTEGEDLKQGNSSGYTVAESIDRKLVNSEPQISILATQPPVPNLIDLPSSSGKQAGDILDSASKWTKTRISFPESSSDRVSSQDNNSSVFSIPNQSVQRNPLPLPMNTGGPVVHHISPPSRGDSNPLTTRPRQSTSEYSNSQLPGAPYFPLSELPASSDPSIIPFSFDSHRSNSASMQRSSISQLDAQVTLNESSSSERNSDSLSFDFLSFFQSNKLCTDKTSRSSSVAPFVNRHDVPDCSHTNGSEPSVPQEHKKSPSNKPSVDSSSWGLFGTDENLGQRSAVGFYGGRRSPKSNRNSMPSLIPKELAEQLRKGVSFTANVAGGALRINEMKGLPKAPKVSKGALDLSTAALKVLEEDRSSRRATFDEGRSKLWSKIRKSDARVVYPSASTANKGSFESTDSENSIPFYNQSRASIKIGKPVQSASTDIETLENNVESLKSLVKPSISHLECLSIPPLNLESNRSLETKLEDEGEPLVTIASVEPVSLTSERVPPSISSTSDQRPSTTLDKLVLMTFNAGLLEYRIAGVTWYSNPPFTKRRLYHIAPALKKAKCDVIALQEVYEEWQADFLTESLRITYPFIARRISGGAFALHNGLMIMSRFPILHTAFHPFHSVTPIEKMFGSKGMLEATIEIPTIGRVTFLNIHLASGAVDPESEALEALRNDEIRQALEVCDAATKRGEIPVIIGDLNAAPNLCPSNYRIFLENGWRDSFLLAVKGEDAEDPLKELTRLESWNNESERGSDSLTQRVAESMEKARKVLGFSEETVKGLLFGNKESSLRRRLPNSSTEKKALCRHLERSRATNQSSIFGTSEKISRRRRNSHYCCRFGQRRNKQPLVERSSSSNDCHDVVVPISDVSTQPSSGLSPPCKQKSVDADIFTNTVKETVQHNDQYGNECCSRLGDNTDRTVSTSPKESSNSVTPTPSSPALFSEAEEEKMLLHFKDESNNSMMKSSNAKEKSQIALSDDSPKFCSHGIHEKIRSSFPPRYFARSPMSSFLTYPSAKGERRVRRSTLRRKKVEKGRLGSISSDELQPLAVSESRRASLTEGNVRKKSRLHTFLNFARTEGYNQSRKSSTTLEYDLDQDPFCIDIFTWDPRNPLNVIGPHSECHGLRCDHIFLPPQSIAGGLSPFQSVDASVVFTEPTVTVEGCCCGLIGQGSLVTLSDHYAVRIELHRTLMMSSK